MQREQQNIIVLQRRKKRNFNTEKMQIQAKNISERKHQKKTEREIELPP